MEFQVPKFQHKKVLSKLLAEIKLQWCAVIKAYDSVTCLLLKALKDHSEEISIVETFFHEIDNYIQIGKFTEAYKMMQLEKIHSELILFIELLMNQKRDLNAAVNTLQALYELWIREFPVVKRIAMHLRLEGLGPQSPCNSTVAITWTILFAVFYARIWSAKTGGSWSPEANNRIVTFLEAAFVYIIPELLALVFFILPWIRNALEELDWSILYLFTWWFHTRLFVGRGLREGLVNNIKYTLFWIAVLVSKFVFSYVLQIKPLAAPKALLNLGNMKYNWHEFFASSNKIAVVLIWLPVALIYFMDMHIWCSIFSSLVGVAIGLFSHLGEIRNIEQLRVRFQFFASAMQFNLMPEEKLPGPKMTLVKKLRDAIHRLKLRYGLGQPYKKFESSQVEATRFALIFNEIITTFCEEDLISDREHELLELERRSSV